MVQRFCIQQTSAHIWQHTAQLKWIKFKYKNTSKMLIFFKKDYKCEGHLLACGLLPLACTAGSQKNSCPTPLVPESSPPELSSLNSGQGQWTIAHPNFSFHLFHCNPASLPGIPFLRKQLFSQFLSLQLCLHHPAEDMRAVCLPQPSGFKFFGAP